MPEPTVQRASGDGAGKNAKNTKDAEGTTMARERTSRMRWASMSYERGEGLLVSLPSLSGRAVYLGIGMTRWALHVPRGRTYLWHVGFGRQFCNTKPRWARRWTGEIKVPIG